MAADRPSSLRTIITPPVLLRTIALCVLTAGFTTPAMAIDLVSAERAVGVWELQLDGGAQKCTVQLRSEAMGGGYALALPPGCRHVMPGVAAVAVWTLPATNRITMTDRTGKSILSFAIATDGPSGGQLKAKGARGESYTLISAADATAQKRNSGPAVPAPAAQGSSSPAASPAQDAVRRSPIRISAAEMAGRYAILREGTRDTGCMLTLEMANQRAQLAPACRDNGFVVFDPKSWSLGSGGRLELVARKGHSAGFEHMSDGSWQKDPKEGGKPLGFRKM